MREANRSGPVDERTTANGARPKLLLVAATFPPTRCGVGDYTRRLAAELARETHVHVLTGEAEDPEHQHVHPESLPTVGPCPPPRVVSPPMFLEERERVRIARCVRTWDWSALDVLRAAIGAMRPDLVSLQYHGEDFLLHPAVCHLPAIARAEGVPTVVTLHNLQEPRRDGESTPPLEKLLEESAAWITTNALDASELQRRPGAAEKLHEVVSGACLPAPDASVRRPSPGPFRVAYFGFLNPVKGLEHLLGAAALLRDEGHPFRLILAAGLHTDASDRLFDYAQRIEAEIERLELHPVLLRLGYLDDPSVSELLLTSHLAVFPFRDGLSGKNASFWSALDHGTPTLTTHGRGLPPGLVPRENVLLAKPADARALAEEIRWAMQHAEERESLGRAGRDFVRENLGWSTLADRTLAIFHASLARERKVAGA